MWQMIDTRHCVFCNSLDGRQPANLQTALVTWYASASEYTGHILPLTKYCLAKVTIEAARGTTRHCVCTWAQDERPANVHSNLRHSQMCQ
jgi:hypothetical protein